MAPEGRGPRTDRPPSFGRVDLALSVVALCWAVNFSVVKATLAYLPPLTFNAIRLVGASALLLAAARWLDPARPRLAREDRWRIAALGLVGHTAYQILFILGIERTTASSSALLLGLSPVAVAAIGTAAGVERPSRAGWLGIGLSLLGVRFVLADDAGGPASLRGDLSVLAATICWAVYTVFGRGLVQRYGPLRATAWSLAFGTAVFLPLAAPSLARFEYGQAPLAAWAGTGFSFLFGLALAYALWFYGVARVGPTRTAVYANLTPVAAVAVAAVALGEPLGARRLAGAAAILAGIALVRRAPERGAPRDA